MPESRKLGRLAEKPKRETIPDSPENVLRAPVTARRAAEVNGTILKRAAGNRPVGDT